MLAADILPALRNEQQRTQILARIYEVPHIIPTLHTFLEDAKWLEPCAPLLKELLPVECKGSLSRSFAALHDGQGELKIQTREFNNFENRSAVPACFSSWSSYRQFWLFFFRHFEFMGNRPPRKDKSSTKIQKPKIQQQWWVEASKLALALGYRTRPKYRDRREADVKAIQELIRSLYPVRYYDIDARKEQQLVHLVSQVLADAAPLKGTTAHPELVSDTNGCGQDVSDRCGMPHTESLHEDEENLFFNHIYSSAYEESPKRYLTSFAVKRDIFHAFFGIAPDELDGLTFPDDISSGQRNLYDVERSADTGDQPQDGDDVVQETQIVPWQPSCDIDPPEASEDVDPEQVDVNAQRASAYTVESQYSPARSLSPSSDVSGVFANSRQTYSLFQPHLVGNSSTTAPPMFLFGQGRQNEQVSLTYAKRLLFSKRARTRGGPFTVLSPTENGTFRKREADCQDKTSIIDALQLPSASNFIARDNGKRLKMTAPTSILEEARSEELKAVVSVPQNKVQELISRFENFDSDEDL